MPGAMSILVHGHSAPITLPSILTASQSDKTARLLRGTRCILSCSFFRSVVIQKFPHAQGFGHAPGLRVAAALRVGRIAIDNFRELAAAAFDQQPVHAPEICLGRRHC